MKNIEFKIEGMTCQHCVKAVRDELQNLGVEIKDVEIGSAEINYDPETITEEKIKNAVEEAGYNVTEIKNG